MQGEPRRPQRQDTFDLREEIHPDDGSHMQAHADATGLHYGTDEEEHSILEDDSEQEEAEEVYEEDDMSSTLSIPNESIDFDMVYALHSFAATVEGQANVVKGDSLFLMDDSNSYWWLVRVLKTQEVGYIPAENIETPFERLARLNKHRNVDLALATAQEQQEAHMIAQERMLINANRNAANQFTSPMPARTNSNNRRSVHFNSIRSHHRYVPPLREGEVEDEEDEWDTDGFEDEDLDLVGEMYMDDDDLTGMEIDESMTWDDGPIDEAQSRQMRIGDSAPIPDALLPGSLREQQQQQMLRAQQQQQLQQQEILAQQQQQQQQMDQQQQREAQAAQQAQQQAAEAQRQQQQQQVQRQESLRSQNSREQITPDASGQNARRIDPAEVTETRKMTVTPAVARDLDDRPSNQVNPPSITIDEERKRIRDDDASSDDSSKKRARSKDKMPPPVSSSQYNKPQGGKLRKERSSNGGDTTDEEGKEKKKKNSVFGGLFTRGKKDKGKDNKAHTTSVGSMDSAESLTRSDETGSSRHRTAPSSDGTTSPTTVAAQQQQMQLTTNIRSPNSMDSLPSTPDRANPSSVSPHASSLRQRDQQQQALYQKYLNSSPSSPPEAQPSYGLMSASTVLLSSPSNSALGPPAPRPRPGSLILTSPSAADGQANLSVIRVFAGRNLQTEATFKTVLLNPNTTSDDLVRQALQRFRLPSAETENDYYLTVKQVEGGAFAVLEAEEKPLVVFEQLVNETMELPKVKRSSVGSISSIASNLSMHPAIKKLSMNDFTDDSAVKFYLNRRGDGPDDSLEGHDDEDTITADTSHTHETIVASPLRSQFLSPNGLGGSNVTPERFTSPSIRFALQVVIYAEDLPDDMQFHPMTEAIVFKSSLQDPTSPVVVSPALRRKIFMFPKNVTVAEVTELGLERFGIQDGVVDGGDEVEDKTTKRRSGVRVRYGLTVSLDGHERELAPSSKVVDAYPRPPQYRNNQNVANRRRSLDPSQLSFDDLRSDDPVFVLRRATSYRNSTSRRRSSVPLDELALAKIHRESSSSYNSDGSVPVDDGKPKQPSRQEIIAAQRAAQRATQRAIVSATTNSVRGLDVILPGNAMLRSSRYDAGDRMRYSYVEADGETYDISDIVEEEWRDIETDKDLLEGVFNHNKDGIGERLDRFINKIRKGKGKERDPLTAETESRPLSTRSISPSEYSVDEDGHSRSATPASAGFVSKMPNGNETINQTQETGKTSRPGTVTPTAGTRMSPAPTGNHTRRNPSIASVISSEYSTGRGTPVQYTLPRVEEETTSRTMKGTQPQSRQQRRVVLPKDDFGLTQMMSIIEYKALPPKTKEKPPQHPVDEMLFGAPIEPEYLHPDIREIYAPAFKQLEEMDKILDGYIGRSVVGAF
ncbi:hypothetical protein CPB83DRAFT_874859 [Crepidotus variabilis]|uniref:Uncharacterized protein n=1 Tax=Crepidotus variabilis TaxID=179855 RepID=A0A9P6ELB0_9AGAR|nr:hypothetical protein CPB83DRAFT_874859 [Crepidotus variabilis]